MNAPLPAEKEVPRWTDRTDKAWPVEVVPAWAYDALRQALRDIVDPVSAMIRDLPEGCRLDGAAAVRAADNPETYKSIARKALEAS